MSLSRVEFLSLREAFSFLISTLISVSLRVRRSIGAVVCGKVVIIIIIWGGAINARMQWGISRSTSLGDG
jgi:hypothetical protein